MDSIYPFPLSLRSLFASMVPPSRLKGEAGGKYNRQLHVRWQPGRPISRILSGSRCQNDCLNGHLSRRRITPPLVRPTRSAGSLRRLQTSSLVSGTIATQWIPPCAPAWPCSLRGMPGRGHYCPRRGSLTPSLFRFAPGAHQTSPFSPLPGPLRLVARVRRRFFSVARSGRLPRPGCYPAACSVECGLSSAAVPDRIRFNCRDRSVNQVDILLVSC